MKKKFSFINFFKGCALGTGLLPGVSVGTVGIIVNIFDELLDAIANILKDFKKNFIFLLPIILGVIVSGLLSVILQETLYRYIPFELSCLFGGLLLVAIPILFVDLKGKKLNFKEFLMWLLGFAIVVGLAVISIIAKLYWNLDMTDGFLNLDKNLWIVPVVFAGGFIAAVGCILPGVSGAMILFILGIYQPIVGMISGDHSIFNESFRLLPYLILFFTTLIGALSGLICISKVMGKFIKTQKRMTYIFVIGLIIGSFVSLYINQDLWDRYAQIEIYHYFIGAAVAILSFVGFYYLVKKKVINKDCKTQ